MQSIELQDALKKILPEIDEVLASKHIGLAVRPFQAALLLMTNYIEIKDEPKDDNCEKSFFKAIYSSVYSWYLDRYGNALKDTNNTAVPGIVLIYDTPFELSIPLTVSRHGAQDETFWLAFP